MLILTRELSYSVALVGVATLSGVGDMIFLGLLLIAVLGFG